MIVYTNQCLSCFHAKRLRELKNFCKNKGITFEERRTSYNKDWQAEAAEIGMHMPFVYHNGIALPLYDDLEQLC